MKKTLASIVSLAALVVVGCNGAKGGANGSGPGTVEVAAFKGGYDIDFYQKAAEELQQKDSSVKFNVWGNPRVWEQLRPRFVAGNPPDLAFPGWGMDLWGLVYENQVSDWDKYLDEAPYDGQGKWRDTFEPGLLKLGQYNGKQYLMPLYFSMNGWWYNEDLFKQNGWTPPKTYEELLALCPKIKAKGIAPITFQGKYPYYMAYGFLFPWLISSGGIEAFDDCQNLKPGAWKSPAMLQAAKMIAELRDKKFFQEGAIGMSHTESQQQFVEGKVAMIPCGTWLHSEMEKVMPSGFHMGFINPPVLANGKGDPTNVSIGIEPWVLPVGSKHPAEAVKLFKYMTSVEKAKEFVVQKGTLMSIKGSDQVDMPDYLKGAADAFRSSKTVWAPQYEKWYPTVHKAMQDALAALISGNMTPEQFCNACEDEATKVRNDKSIIKRQTEPR